MVCQFCGARGEVHHLTKEMLMYENDVHICADCLRKAYYCDYCHKIHTVKIGEKKCCPSCADGKNWCVNCGQLHDGLVDGFCPTCNAIRRTCEDCGKKVMSYHNTPKGTLCDACTASHKFQYCVHCETFVYDKDYDVAMGCCVPCKKFMSQCYVCGTVRPRKGMKKIYKDTYVCRGHVHEDRCSCCGVETSLVNYNIPGHIDTAQRNIAVCGTCLVETKYGIIHNYSFKPAAKFMFSPTERNDSIFFGVENEVSFEEGVRARLRMCWEYQKNDEGEDLFYVKYDASIPNGFEVVTHPFTFQYFKTEFPLDKVIPQLDLPYVSTTQCGMHIHITKSCLSNAAVLKLLQFIADNESFIETIAERTQTEYCRAIKKQSIAGIAINKKSSGDRHTAINLHNDATIELRIFKGATTKEQYSKNVEFTHALVMFCSLTSLKNLNVKKFSEFVQKYPVEYVNLIEFMRTHSIL